MQTNETKIQFKMGKIRLISKVIDGKFPDYKKVVPTNNEKILTVGSKDFIDSIERVTTVSLDRKEGVKLNIRIKTRYNFQLIALTQVMEMRL